ncbi:MAG: hypothetical protein RLZZ04_408 [Cyanobacteriota bacterium]|jgi:hypothetical protein
MNKYYILNLDPQATHEWDRCVIRNPITGARPDFQEEVAQVMDSQPGSYLIRVNLQIEILEQNTTPVRKAVEGSGEKKAIAIAEKRLAS